MSQKVWIYYHGNHNVGGGGATVKVYSSAEKAIQSNPHEWQLKSPNFYESENVGPYESLSICEVEVDSDDAFFD